MAENWHRSRWGVGIALVLFLLVRLGIAFLLRDPHRYDEPPPTAERGGEGCPGTRVEPGYGRVAWTVRSIVESTQAGPFYPLAAPGGFVVAVGDCVAFVDTGGDLRWTIRGAFRRAAVAGNTVVLAGFDGWPRVVGLDASTGRRLWGSGARAREMAGGDEVVFLAGDSATALSAANGKRIGPEHQPGSDFRYVLASGGLLVAGGSASDTAGGVVALDGSGRRVADTTVDILVPRPVAVTPEVIVVVSDGGLTRAGGDKVVNERPTMAGIERESGRTRWSRPLRGLLPPVVATGGILAMPLEHGFAGVDASSGEVVWERPDLKGEAERLDEETLFVRTAAGPIHAIDARTGATRWSRTIDGFPVYWAASIGGRGLLLTTSDGRLLLLQASDGAIVGSGEGSRVSGSAQIGLVSPPPAVVGGVALSLVDAQKAIAITDLP